MNQTRSYLLDIPLVLLDITLVLDLLDATHHPSVFHMIHITVGVFISWAPSATQDAAL